MIFMPVFSSPGADNVRRLDAVVSSPLDLSSAGANSGQHLNNSALLCSSEQGFSQLDRETAAMRMMANKTPTRYKVIHYCIL